MKLSDFEPTLIESIKKAVKVGLYPNEEVAVRDILPMLFEKEDDFTKIAAQQALHNFKQNLPLQINALIYNNVRNRKGIIYLPWVSSDFTNVKAAMLLNGPKFNGAVVGPKGKTAEFTVRRINEKWCHFVGDNLRTRRTPISKVAFEIGCPVNVLKAAAEEAIRSCTYSNEWIDFESIPIAVDTLPESLATLLKETPYGHVSAPAEIPDNT